MANRRPAKSRAADGASAGPAVILIRPQLAENVGMVARAMLNCGLLDLRLVNPRDGWPNEKAESPSSGAGVVLDGARVFESTRDAVADLQQVYATTARSRYMTKDVTTPRGAAVDMRGFISGGGRAGILFGPEAMGMDNDDVALADTIIEVPLNPAFPSLNLAQAVLLVGYEWFQTADETPERQFRMHNDTRPATKDELVHMFEHLEAELDACGFLRVAEKRPIMVRNIRNLFQRAGLTEQEIRTLRGVIAGLVGGKKG